MSFLDAVFMLAWGNVDHAPDTPQEDSMTYRSPGSPRSDRPATLGALKEAGFQHVSVKDEIRRNVIARLHAGEPLFPGIVGYDETVVPQIVNALLSKHDFILLGLRGQAKSRILRELPRFLDEWTPAIAGSPVRDDPFRPASRKGKAMAAEMGNELPIAWLHRDERYAEKLATPDVTMADLIGDIDPIKAAVQKRTYADEEIIHYGIIPRMNRGIFAINELPDLQPRIQVGLLNIMQEKDVQIRGFEVRIPMDLLLVYSANPEDYTNRGNIITPLKDRIGSQIVTHYPKDLQTALSITRQEAWTERKGEVTTVVPPSYLEIVEEAALQARRSEFVDQSSGVSVRLTITLLENLVSNLERRGLRSEETVVWARIADLWPATSAMTGKVELVYEGEQEGITKVARHLLGKAVRAVFLRTFPEVYDEKEKPRQRPERRPKAPGASLASEEATAEEPSPYKRVTGWFASGKTVVLSDETPFAEHVAALRQVEGLEEVAREHAGAASDEELACAMELVLEGLHQCSLIGKEDMDGRSLYSDMLGRVLSQLDR